MIQQVAQENKKIQEYDIDFFLIKDLLSSGDIVSDQGALFPHKNGNRTFITGNPGVGKTCLLHTMLCKNLGRELSLYFDLNDSHKNSMLFGSSVRSKVDMLSRIFDRSALYGKLDNMAIAAFMIISEGEGVIRSL